MFGSWHQMDFAIYVYIYIYTPSTSMAKWLHDLDPILVDLLELLCLETWMAVVGTTWGLPEMGVPHFIIH